MMAGGAGGHCARAPALGITRGMSDEPMPDRLSANPKSPSRSKSCGLIALSIIRKVSTPEKRLAKIMPVDFGWERIC